MEDKEIVAKYKELAGKSESGEQAYVLFCKFNIDSDLVITQEVNKDGCTIITISSKDGENKSGFIKRIDPFFPPIYTEEVPICEYVDNTLICYTDIKETEHD